MVYWQYEPFGSPVDDHRAEQLVSLLFQANTPANTATPIFFDRRDPDEIARDAWLHHARNPVDHDALDARVSNLFEQMIARQNEASPPSE